MGQRKKYDAALQQMMAMFAAAQKPSAIESQYQTDWNNLGNWLNAKDYRNLPAGTSIDMLPIAEMQKMRQMVRGRDVGGQVASGAKTNMLANQQRELGDNQFLQDYSGAYENKIGELSNRRDALGNMLMSSDSNRKQLGIQGSQAYLQGLSNRPKSMWSSLLPSLIQGGASIGAAFV